MTLTKTALIALGIAILTISTQAMAEQTKVQTYGGEPISLQFADIPVRAVFDILAGFTGINIITDDSVTGNMTIRMHHVPWDEAFDVILRTRNLSAHKQGNVWIISSNSIQANAPIVTEYIRLHYASAEDLSALIMGEKTQRGNINQSSQQTQLPTSQTLSRLHERQSAMRPSPPPSAAAYYPSAVQ